MKKFFKFLSVINEIISPIALILQNIKFIPTIKSNELFTILISVGLIVSTVYLIYYYISEFVKRINNKFKSLEESNNDKISVLSKITKEREQDISNKIEILKKSNFDDLIVLNEIIKAKELNIFKRIQGVSGENKFDNFESEVKYVIDNLSNNIFKNKTNEEIMKKIKMFYYVT